MPGSSRQYTYRLRARPGEDKKYRIVIQRRVFLFFWKDWYPVENAVRSLQKEYIDHFNRMQDIISELKEAEAWVEQNFAFLNLENKREGTSAPFKGDAQPYESLMPDHSKEFKEIREGFPQSQGRNRPGAGSRSVYLGTTSKRFDLSSLNRENFAAEFGADHVLDYRPPQQDQSRNKGQNKGQNQNNRNQDKE
jgi:hypothetical protein